ncbi:E3 ubiquitin-protein ligase TRIM32-like isoform X2 [Eriocheir sinensis]|uniref:E3 ubiquitin-protein ligase TRIM32-like isoform X1 n=1 Tax=Eriocheir sinensis TaxID=95602 RepID=UPI0021C6D00F|nr:E3 ubiquitin-protein ligase TRIM32-like isoform X1 [Eriocheir sinensis]XP_050739515.1 E3 ubiquitin-protein ligase TRIM32-like isoform X2 [Eriocheir sinensis]XP_050739516.1 E3 ubiquitin-protein ligase TRIM32-like isoform X2 [Eriocheir sinensis]XP_050739518.1 E3 ubiquitin-protein ligase TRIM32-like isoform X1 [Eriocheir sinensis]XP_050739519.1 E3 ubiquitin-protein ligase TRIM32-like isoform X2 [Eriocheir sinensis]XP_050739520.1 E3 ubiquitin-protein ligase TRIM32-like isoform X2 [Eriocheir sin
MEAAGRGGRRQVKKMNTSGSPAECPVCMTGYDGTVQRPRTLPCGHTVCTLCIDQLKVQGRVACPECRVSHAVPEGGQFPVSYAVEALIRMMRDAEVAAAAEASPPPSAGEGKGAAAAAGKKEAAGLSKKMRSFLQEQEATLVAAITACREAQSQLDQYQTTLAGWRERQQQLEDRLLGLVDQSRSARELLQQEESRAAAKEEELKKGEQGMQAVLETLRTLTTEQEAGAVVTEMFRCTGEAEQAVEECREGFPDASTVTTARKVNEASSAALEAVQAALETLATEEPRPQADPDSTVLDRLHLIWTGSLTAEDLRSLTQPVRRLLEAGRVFAVHQAEGQRRHARISLEAGQLCLHALKDLPPPRCAATLQVSEVVPPSPPCTVFLDLSWPGSAPRRVQIRLSPDTPWGRQFILLCTGQRGPSYVNTRLLGVVKKGEAGEYVKGGDYESNDGKGSCVLLPGLGEGEYRKSGRAGDVCGVVWTDPTRGECGRFGINTRDRQDGGGSPRVFGEVVDGLHVVAEAAQHRDIKEVTVADCGVVL